MTNTLTTFNKQNAFGLDLALTFFFPKSSLTLQNIPPIPLRIPTFFFEDLKTVPKAAFDDMQWEKDESGSEPDETEERD